MVQLARYKLGTAATHAKMQYEWLQTRGSQTLPSGVKAPSVNQQLEALVEREDVNLATCVRIISDSVAWLPLRVIYQDTDSQGNQTRVPDNDHWFNQLWRKPGQNTTSELQKHCAASLLTTGNAYLARTEDPDAPRRRRRNVDPVAQMIQPKPSWRMFAKVDLKKQLITEYVERLDLASDRIWPLEQITHLRLYNINDPLYGRSGVEPLRRQLWTEYMAEMMQLAHFAADGSPRAVFTPKEAVTAPQRKQIEEFYENRINPEDKHRLQTMPVPGEFTAVTPTMSDMEFAEMRRFHRERTYSLIGIPPFLGGVTKHANWANAIVQESTFWRHTMIPMVSVIADFLTRQLLWRLEDDENYHLEFDLSNVSALRTDQLKQARTAVVVSGGPVMTPNEARTKFYEMEDVEGGDELRTPAAGVSVTPNDGSAQADGEAADKGDDSPMMTQIKTLGIALPGGQPAARFERKVAIITRDDAGKIVQEAEIDDVIFAKARADLKDFVEDNETEITTPMKQYWRGLHDRVQDGLDEATIEGAYMTGLYGVITKGSVDPNNLDGFLSMQAEEELLRKLFEPIIIELMGEVGSDATSRAIAAGGIGVEFDIRNPKIQEAIVNRLNNIAGTTDTTFKDIRRILLNGYNNGWDIQQVAQAITKQFHQYNITRATLIARTELTGLANTASRLAWMQNGATHKTWVATQDSRTRDYHVMYNGERVRIDGYFLHGPEPLMEPCDTNAQLAANVCNCRCGLIYDFDPVDYLDEALAENLAAE